jgi:signal transduction histidine kinase
MQSEHKANILLVDDNPKNLLALEAILENLGQNLVRANSGEEVLKCLLKQDFAVILLDVQMPGMDGFEVARLVRERERSSHTPIIFLTAISKSDEHIIKGYSLGAVDYLLKPIVPEILRAKVSVFVELYNKTEEVKLQQLARKEAEVANRLKDEFLATLSHELRTPLTAILGWSRMLRANKLDEVATTRAIETIERNAKAQAQLIEDLLDISRIITGKLTLDIQNVEIVPIIQSAIDTVRPAADAKSISLQVILDPWAGKISADPMRLPQIVWNLLSNAIKFTPKGGQVEVRLENLGSFLEITVSDSGKGINPEFLPYVFDRFRQADGSITRAHGGLGLGLAIVRHLAELHGGTVDAISEGEGLGATFIVRLPFKETYTDLSKELIAEPATSNLPANYQISLEGLKVLVVDDEDDTREMLMFILEQKGVEVKVASSTTEAIGILKQWGPDLLISDIGMPGEDGYALIRKVRAMEAEQNSHIPAIALTAFARGEDRIRVLSAGFQMHVPKPIDPVELIMVVATLTERLGTVPTPTAK